MESLIYLGYGGLFLAGFLASTILPLSSEGVLSLMLAYNYDWFTCIIIISIGNTLGGMTGYYLGRWNKLQSAIKYLGVKEYKIEKWKSKIQKYGSLLAFLTWTPVFGDVISIALGYYRLRVGNVLFFMFAGKFIRYIFWGILTSGIIQLF